MAAHDGYSRHLNALVGPELKPVQFWVILWSHSHDVDQPTSDPTAELDAARSGEFNKEAVIRDELEPWWQTPVVDKRVAHNPGQHVFEIQLPPPALVQNGL